MLATLADKGPRGHGHRCVRVALRSARAPLKAKGPTFPASFNVPHEEEFDTDYMRALSQAGYDMAAQGYSWQKTPPGC